MDLTGKNVLVTGGAGFIGSHLVESLLRLEANVTAFDNFDDFYSGKERNLASSASNPRFSLVKGDILDGVSLSAAMKNKDVVFHLAGQAGIRYCNEHPRKADDVNSTGTMDVMLASKENGVRRIVYASSSSLYGAPIKVPIDETQQTNPTSIYGATKLAGEKYVLTLGGLFGIQATCLRYFSVYGPRGRPDQVVTAFASKVKKGESPVIYGDGTHSRDFTYVTDVVSATIFSAMNDEAQGQIMNIGYGKEIKIKEVARKIIQYFDSTLEIDYRAESPGDFPRTLCDNTKAKSMLSWRPRVDFEAGLVEELKWFAKGYEASSTMNVRP